MEYGVIFQVEKMSFTPNWISKLWCKATSLQHQIMDFTEVNEMIQTKQFQPMDWPI